MRMFTPSEPPDDLPPEWALPPRPDLPSAAAGLIALAFCIAALAGFAALLIGRFL